MKSVRQKKTFCVFYVCSFVHMCGDEREKETDVWSIDLIWLTSSCSPMGGSKERERSWVVRSSGAVHVGGLPSEKTKVVSKGDKNKQKWGETIWIKAVEMRKCLWTQLHICQMVIEIGIHMKNVFPNLRGTETNVYYRPNFSNFNKRKNSHF